MEEQKPICIRAQLVAKRDGDYTVYVFDNLDLDAEQDDKYIMCTECPNWNGQALDVFQEGYLSYKFVIAGIDTFYHRVSSQRLFYQYTANYFLDFVPITHVLRDGRVSESEKLIIT